MKWEKIYTLLIAAFTLTVLLSACGGGGSGSSSSSTTTTGLKVADKVSVVDAQGLTGTVAKIVPLRFAALSLPANSDYNSDITFTYVQDRTTEAFKTVNQILCMVSQTKYEAMLNKGDYKALINQSVCQGNDSASNAGNSASAGTSASSSTQYVTWTVNSSRADNNSPQIVKAWVHESARDSEPAKLVQAKLTITEAATSTNPYGIFNLNFAGYPVDASGVVGTTRIMYGVLKSERDSASGKVLLKFAEADAAGNRSQKASLEKNSSGTGGGSVYSYENYNSQVKEGQLDFAYNSNLFHRKKDGAAAGSNDDVCLDRASFETSAWRYGLYNSTTGSRITVNSGFPIKASKADGSTAYGWVGYYGLWLPEGFAVNDGDTVKRQTYGTNASELTYTAVVVGGKLKKHTKKTTTLDGIKNIPLEGYMEMTNNSPLSFRVVWDATSAKLYKVASAPQSSSGPPVWTDLNPRVEIDFNRLNFGELTFWSQSLGGQVRLKLAGCSPSQANPGFTACTAPTGTTPVVYYVEDITYPGDTVPALSCYDQCPKAGASGMDPTALTYSAAAFNPQNPNASTRHDYTFSNLVLMDGSNRALLATAPQGQSWGFNSGPLFEASSSNLALLACDWNTAQTCGWKAWSALDVFYTWETGPNTWNKLTAVKDSTSGAVVKFEPPLRVEYTHSQSVSSKPDYKYNGSKFFLEYAGFGQLQGIPGKCVDMNDGTLTNDCSGSNVRWVPEFTIPAESTVTNSSDSSSYLVKPLEMEQRMTKRPIAECAALPLTTYTLPTVADWVDPALGTEPTVTAAPAVIGGVVQ